MTFVIDCDGNPWEPHPGTGPSDVQAFLYEGPARTYRKENPDNTKFVKGWHKTMIKRVIGMASCALLTASLLAMGGCGNNRDTSSGAASTGGCALSSVIFGVLGDVFPLYLVFTAGCLLSVLPMAYMCLHKHAREFVLMN